MQYFLKISISMLVMLLSPFVFSQVNNTWTSSTGIPVRSSDGNCVGNSYATPQTSSPECGGVKKTEAKTAPAIVPITLKGDALFDFNKSAIKPEGIKTLQNLISKVKAMNYKSILIIGHTDNVGSEKYNLKLSLKRAESIKSLFVKNGIDSKKISVQGKGFSEPIASNKTALGRSQNRRAVIQIDQVN